MPKEEVVANDPATWVAAVWEALDTINWKDHSGYRVTEEFENEVKTAMVWIAEALGVKD